MGGMSQVLLTRLLKFLASLTLAMLLLAGCTTPDNDQQTPRSTPRPRSTVEAPEGPKNPTPAPSVTTPRPLSVTAARECENKAANLSVYLEDVFDLATQVSRAGNVEFEQAQEMYYTLVGELKAASVLISVFIDDCRTHSSPSQLAEVRAALRRIEEGREGVVAMCEQELQETGFDCGERPISPVEVPEGLLGSQD